MIVITMTSCPSKLRGDLTKWLQEIDTGVFVGKLSARVREELWKRIKENIGAGKATMCYSAQTAQGYHIETINTDWEPVEYDGLLLMRHPHILTERSESKQEKDCKKQKTVGESLRKEKSVSSGKACTQKRKKKAEKVPIGSEYVVIDLETTGLEVEECQIIELAAIRVFDHKVAGRFCCMIKCRKELPQEIVQLTGITDQMLKEEGIEEEEAVRSFVEFVGESPAVLHNAKFDLSFINKLYLEYGYPEFANRYEDTLKLSRRLIRNVDNYRLATLAEHMQIDISNAHRALPDSMITMELFEKLNEIAGGTL